MSRRKSTFDGRNVLLSIPLVLISRTLKFIQIAFCYLGGSRARRIKGERGREGERVREKNENVVCLFITDDQSRAKLIHILEESKDRRTFCRVNSIIISSIPDVFEIFDGV